MGWKCTSRTSKKSLYASNSKILKNDQEENREYSRYLIKSLGTWYVYDLCYQISSMSHHFTWLHFWRIQIAQYMYCILKIVCWMLNAYSYIFWMHNALLLRRTFLFFSFIFHLFWVNNESESNKYIIILAGPIPLKQSILFAGLSKRRH